MRITNETIKKLTNKEMNGLQCSMYGIMLYRGTIKKRIKSDTTKVTLATDSEVHFENAYCRHEFIKLASTSIFDGKEEQDWAYRVFIKEHNEYEQSVQVLNGLYFIK